MTAVKKERWASRVGLVLAMAGNAVGLGNFLRFPAQAVKNGGGAFLIPYIVALILMGLPLIWVEWAMGRYGGQFGHHSTPGIFDSIGKRPYWKYLGVFGLWANLMIASYYLYIESWTLAYAGNSLIGGFSTPESSGKFFEWLIGSQSGNVFAVSPWGMLFFAFCAGLNIFILSRGLAKGIEFIAKIGMPLLILFAAILAVRGLMIVPGAGPQAVDSSWADKQAIAWPTEGLAFLWTPNFDTLWNPKVWIAAAGQIFFTLSIGMGSIHCYASYLRENDDITLTGATAAWTNEFCEVILGGTILIPIAVAYYGLSGLDETIRNNSGLGLGFVVFPKMFLNWGYLGPAAGFLWFGLLFFAAITSSLAMGQPIMSFLQTEFGFSREKSAMGFGMMLLPVAIPVACCNLDTFFTEFDDWAGTFGLVIFAFIETVLFVWIFGMDRGWAEIAKGGDLKVPGVFFYIIKYVTPVFLLIILLANMFQPTGGPKDPKTGERGWEAYVTGIAKGEALPAWEFSGDGMLGKILMKDIPINDTMPEKEQSFKQSLRNVRNVDRLVMVGTFLFFSAMVAFAWKKRAARKGDAR